MRLLEACALGVAGVNVGFVLGVLWGRALRRADELDCALRPYVRSPGRASQPHE